MQSKHTTITYTVVHANGSIEKVRIPAWVGSPEEIAQKLPHSLFFYDVPKGSSVYAISMMRMEETTVVGPATILVSKEVRYHVPYTPKTDGEAFRLWKEYAEQRQAA